MSTQVIGVDASRIPTNGRTGTERYSQRIIEGLLSYPSPYRLRLYRRTRAPLPFPIESDRAEVRIIPFPRLWTHLRLAWELHQYPVALLFIPAHVLPLSCPVPAVVTVHDLGFRYEPNTHPWQQRWYLELGTRWSAWKARHIITPSETTKNDLIRFYRLPAERITVIHHGIDTQFFRRTPEECEAVRQRYALRKPFLLHVGTMQPRKNLLALLEAFQLLARQDEELELVLVGKRGWLAKPIEKVLAMSPFRERVRWLGYVADDDLPALYSAADVFVFPSLYEGFGLPVLEALACGTPVVTSNRGALAEIAGPALQCDPTDPAAIAQAVRMAREPIERANFAVHGPQHAREFSWERATQQTLDVLVRVMSDAHTVSAATRH